MSKPKVDPLKHLHGEAFLTECGLRTMAYSTRTTHNEERATCEDCKRIKRQKHETKMASNSSYRRFHEQVAAFAALGIKAGEYGAIKLTFSEADKVLRKLRRLARTPARKLKGASK